MLVLDRDTNTKDYREETREGRQGTRTLSQYGLPIEMTDMFVDEKISLPGSASDTQTGENGLACQVAPDAADYIECHSLEPEVDAAVRLLQTVARAVSHGISSQAPLSAPCGPVAPTPFVTP